MNKMNLLGVTLIYGLVLNVDAQLIFVNSGVIKLVAAVAVPIAIDSPGRSLGWTVNIQALYRLPDNITYFEPYKIVQRREAQAYVETQPVFSFIENEFERWGMCGTDCLQRLICESAGAELTSDQDPVLAKLVQSLFTPTENWRKDYHLAHSRGFFSNPCSMYYNCSILDSSLNYNL